MLPLSQLIKSSVNIITLYFIVIFSGVFLFRLAHLGPYDTKRILFLVLVFISSLACLLIRSIYIPRLSQFSGWIMMGLCSLALIACVKSASLFWSVVDIGQQGLLILLFIFTLTLVREIPLEKSLRQIFYGVSLLSLSYFVLLMPRLWFAINSGYGFDEKITAINFSHPRFFNQLQVFIVPFLLTPLLITNRINTKAIITILLSIHFFILLLASARGAILSLLVGFGLMFCLLHRSISFRILQCALLASLIAWLSHQGLLLLLVDDTITQQPVGISVSHTSGRFFYWQQLITDWLQSPFFGSGPMSYAWQSSIHFGAHPHNATLQFLFEYGGLFCFLLALLVVRWAIVYTGYFYSIESKQDQAMQAMLVAALINGLVLAQFSGVLVMPFAQLFFVLCLALLIAQLPLMPIKKTRFCFLLSLMFLVLMILAKPTQPSTTEKRHPRIWQDGALTNQIKID